MGQVVDTNSVYLAQQLKLLGFDVLYKYTVGDNDARLKEILGLAHRDCDLIITTGGLGPTEDDITKEIVTEYLDDVLVEHEESLQFFRTAKEAGVQLSKNNLKQGMLPSRAVVFDTDKGTAPGFALSNAEGKMVICMPGPPREMTRMYERRVRPYLEQFREGIIYHQDLRIFGRGESRVETDIIDLIDAQTDPTIATYAKACECSIRVASKRATLAEAKAACKPVVDKIMERIGDYVYSTCDEELVQVVGRKLIEKNLTISVCESCTGGLLAEQLTTVPGISAVFDRGLVTYTYNAKMDELGVKKETLDELTAVCPEVALQMVEGLYNKTKSDFCLSVTGIAGPSTEPGKEVGEIYIGYAYKGDCNAVKLLTHNNDRAWNRKYAVLTMLNIVNRIIEDKPVKVSSIMYTLAKQDTNVGIFHRNNTK